MSNQDVYTLTWKEDRQKLTGWPVKKEHVFTPGRWERIPFLKYPLQLVLLGFFQPEQREKFRIQKVLGFMACYNGQCPKCHIYLSSVTLCYPQNPLKVDCKCFHNAALIHISIHFAGFVYACPRQTRKYTPVQYKINLWKLNTEFRIMCYCAHARFGRIRQYRQADQVRCVGNMFSRKMNTRRHIKRRMQNLLPVYEIRTYQRRYEQFSHVIVTVGATHPK